MKTPWQPAVVTAVGGGTTGTAVSAAAKPKWLTISGFWDGTIAPEPVGTASGRGWIGFYSSASRWAFGSLGRAGGRLSFVKAALAAQRPLFVLGSELVYHLPDASGKPGELRTAPLLSNGSIGTPRAVPNDPEKIPPQELDPVVTDGIRVGGRIVWLLEGAKLSGGNLAKAYLWACCTSTGQLSDLTRFIKQARMNLSWQLGVDSKNRLWVTWLQPSRTAVVGPVKLLELDPETLAPRTSTAATLGGGSTATTFELSCAAFCRVVMTDLLSGDLLASSPGQRSAIRMASGTRNQPATLLAASDSSGRLTAALIASRSPGPAKAPVERIDVVRGDARGSHARSVASVDLPSVIDPTDYDHFALYATAVATFVPGGLEYFALYRGTPSRVLAGYVPIAR